MSIDPRAASEPNTSDLAVADKWEKLIDAALKSRYAGEEEFEFYFKEPGPSERVKVEIDRRYKASGWKGGVYMGTISGDFSRRCVVTLYKDKRP